MIMLHSVNILLLVLGLVWAREPMKTRTLPTISNSLVNLGKMDITFHMNGAKEPEQPEKDTFIPLNQKSASAIEECMCNNLRDGNFKDPIFEGASNLFNKILLSNDLFNFNKDPISGPQCCESHEESIVTFEISPKAGMGMENLRKPSPPVPQIIFDNFMPRKSFPETKTKTVEIFLFPKNGKKPWIKKFSSLPTKASIKKDIKVVGEKEPHIVYDTIKLETSRPNVLDKMKYETVESVTVKNEKEIGIKDQEDYVKTEAKVEPPKDGTPSGTLENNV